MRAAVSVRESTGGAGGAWMRTRPREAAGLPWQRCSKLASRELSHPCAVQSMLCTVKLPATAWQ
ncbi:hypothetical protein [Streptomyces sp. NPDC060031]|uniref:hypothetical protein n=1 Tax=Streptomyces sp. NPDC060031 TaxID=3347043 RepID=UPI00369BF01C